MCAEIHEESSKAYRMKSSPLEQKILMSILLGVIACIWLIVAQSRIIVLLCTVYCQPYLDRFIVDIYKVYIIKWHHMIWDHMTQHNKPTCLILLTSHHQAIGLTFVVWLPRK